MPTLVSLTYDSRYPLGGGRTGALLAGAWAGYDPRVDPRQGPVYAIDPSTGTSTLASFAPYGAGCQTDANNVHCGDTSIFSHDVFNDRLLSLVQSQTNSNDVAAWLDPNGDRSDIACFNSQWPDSWGAAAATVAGRDAVYALLEDDSSFVKVDLTTCRLVGGFKIPPLIEDPSEDEQIACDPLSSPTSTLIWVRDSVSGDAQAFPAHDAYCPFPTTLVYDGPAAAKPGAPVTLCFTLSGNLDGQWRNLPGEPIDVLLAGARVGHAATDPSGRGCVATRAPLTGGTVAVQGRFAGTNAYLPASADGSLLVLSVAVANGPLGGTLSARPSVDFLHPSRWPSRRLSQAVAREPSRRQAGR